MQASSSAIDRGASDDGPGDLPGLSPIKIYGGTVRTTANPNDIGGTGSEDRRILGGVTITRVGKENQNLFYSLYVICSVRVRPTSASSIGTPRVGHTFRNILQNPPERLENTRKQTKERSKETSFKANHPYVARNISAASLVLPPTKTLHISVLKPKQNDSLIPSTWI